MWIPSHVGVMGNEQADRLAGEAALSGFCQRRECWTVGSVSGAGVPWADIPIRFCLLSHWYLGLGVLIAADVLSNHSCLRSHLGRINIVENFLCVCLRDYETIDHVMWT
jgi:hypothetical protein